MGAQCCVDQERVPDDLNDDHAIPFEKTASQLGRQFERVYTNFSVVESGITEGGL
jgi:hypothetical protein